MKRVRFLHLGYDLITFIVCWGLLTFELSLLLILGI